MTAALERLALRIDPRVLSIAVGVLIAALGVMGILRYGHKAELRLFNLDGERNVPATFSAALWVGVAVLALLVARAGAGKAWAVLAIPILFVAADEFAEIHERLERITGIDWQILYSPLAIVAAVLWVVIGTRLRRLGAGFGLFAAATVAGAVSQVLEKLEYGPHDEIRPGFREMVVSEELLEMIAALLLGLSFLTALKARSPA